MRQGVSTVPSSSSGLREVVVCYAGFVIAIRGASLILDWAARYDGPPVRLELMGPYDAASEKGVNRLMRNPQNAGRMNIRLHGALPHAEVLRIMRDGDIGICLTDPTVLNYRYAYPIKVVEYMSQGLVTVATDGHGVRAFVRHGENGFVSDYDLDSFARTMTEAIEACANEGRRRELVENAIRTVEARDWDIVNSALLADIGTVVGRTK
jgi:glycosyltransferase involved in cell wall biosynthesis